MAGEIVLFLAEEDVRTLFGDRADDVLAQWHSLSSGCNVNGTQVYEAARAQVNTDGFRQSPAVAAVAAGSVPDPVVLTYRVTTTAGEVTREIIALGITDEASTTVGLTALVTVGNFWHELPTSVAIPADFQLNNLNAEAATDFADTVAAGMFSTPSDSGDEALGGVLVSSPPPMPAAADAAEPGPAGSLPLPPTPRRTPAATGAAAHAPLGTPAAVVGGIDLLALSESQLDEIEGMTPAVRSAALALGRTPAVQTGLLTGGAVNGRRLFGTTDANASVMASRTGMATGSSGGPPSSPMASMLRSDAADAEALAVPEIRVEGVAVLPVRRRELAAARPGRSRRRSRAMSDAALLAVVGDDIWEELGIAPPTPLVHRAAAVETGSVDELVLPHALLSDAARLDGEYGTPPSPPPEPRERTESMALWGTGAAAGATTGLRHRLGVDAADPTALEERLGWVEQRVAALETAQPGGTGERHRYVELGAHGGAASDDGLMEPDTGFVRTGDNEYQEEALFPMWLWGGVEAAAAAAGAPGNAVGRWYRRSGLFHDTRPSYHLRNTLAGFVGALLCFWVAFLTRAVRVSLGGNSVTVTGDDTTIDALSEDRRTYMEGIGNAVRLPDDAVAAGDREVVANAEVLRLHDSELRDVGDSVNNLRAGMQADDVNAVLDVMGRALLQGLPLGTAVEWTLTASGVGLLIYSGSSFVAFLYRGGQWCRARGQWRGYAEIEDGDFDMEVGPPVGGPTEGDTVADFENPLYQSPPGTVGPDPHRRRASADAARTPGRGTHAAAPLLERADGGRRGGRRRWGFGGRRAAPPAVDPATATTEHANGSSGVTSDVARTGASVGVDTVTPSGTDVVMEADPASDAVSRSTSRSSARSPAALVGDNGGLFHIGVETVYGSSVVGDDADTVAPGDVDSDGAFLPPSLGAAPAGGGDDV